MKEEVTKIIAKGLECVQITGSDGVPWGLGNEQINYFSDLLAQELCQLFEQLPEQGLVRLAKDQSLPEIAAKPMLPQGKTKTIQVEVAEWWDEEALLSCVARLTQQIMVNKGFRKVEPIEPTEKPPIIADNPYQDKPEKECFEWHVFHRGCQAQRNADALWCEQKIQQARQEVAREIREGIYYNEPVNPYPYEQATMVKRQAYERCREDIMKASFWKQYEEGL